MSINVTSLLNWLGVLKKPTIYGTWRLLKNVIIIHSVPFTIQPSYCNQEYYSMHILSNICSYSMHLPSDSVILIGYFHSDICNPMDIYTKLINLKLINFANDLINTFLTTFFKLLLHLQISECMAFFQSIVKENPFS